MQDREQDTPREPAEPDTKKDRELILTNVGVVEHIDAFSLYYHLLLLATSCQMAQDGTQSKTCLVALVSKCATYK